MGGFVSIWKEDFLDQIEVLNGQRWLCIKGMIQEFNFQCVICVVYDPHERSEKIIL